MGCSADYKFRKWTKKSMTLIKRAFKNANIDPNKPYNLLDITEQIAELEPHSGKREMIGLNTTMGIVACIEYMKENNLF